MQAEKKKRYDPEFVRQSFINTTVLEFISITHRFVTAARLHIGNRRHDTT